MLKELRRAVQARRAAARASDAYDAGDADDADGAGAPADGDGATAAAFGPASPPSTPTPEATARRADARARAAEASAELAAALDKLDDDQLAAVVAEGDVAVCAAVGSGKTTVLLHRVCWLMTVCEVPADAIVVLTFTRKAARDIAERLRALSGIGPPTLMGTFHSVARALLTGPLPIETLGFSRRVRVLDTSERDALWAQLIAQHGLDVKYRARLPARMAALAEGQVRFGTMRRDDDIIALAERYEAHKRAIDAMDYDDLLVCCGALLPTLPAARRPAHVLIDELQDCDGDQLDLVDGLRGADTRVYGVGDPHQTIYGWRGSRTDIFGAFVARFAARRLVLGANYRASAELVHAAAGLLLGARATLDAGAATMTPTRPAGEQVRVLRHHDDVAEARWVAGALAAHADTRCAVLARTRRQLEPIADACAAAGVTVATSPARAGTEALARWLHALLRAGLDRDDLAALRILLCDRARGLVAPAILDNSSLDALEGDAHARVAARLDALARRSRRFDHGLARRLLAALAATAAAAGREDGREGGRDDRREDGLDDALAALIAVAEELLGPTRAAYAAERALLAQLFAAWSRVAAEAGGGAAGLRVALDEALVDGHWLLAPAARQLGDGAALLTVHAAKGLEFDRVWIIGANDGAFPVAGAMASPGALAEEQRLLFVAMTRARDGLEISWLTRPTLPRATGAPSPLLRVLPQASVAWLDTPEAAPRAPRTAPHGSPSSDSAAAQAAATDADEALAGWAPGARVRHRRYGSGVVHIAESDHYVVRFDRVGERTFARAMANLVADDGER